ncbi:MAG: class I SAM-dependent methyltransferase [Bacteroidaceae bacterium]|nr:class I SAM-dependent methyltransferase [Bacteroidaceae bacterium]
MAIDNLENYIKEHVDSENDYLYRLYRATNTQLLYGRMASGHLQGRVLSMLSKMIRPTTILELGTFTGYSALCLAEGLEEGGRLYTFEINDEIEDFTRPWLEQSEMGKSIDFRIGDALVEVPKMGQKFDLVFIDADKRKYLQYYNMVKPMMNKGGYIIADNTLWDGHVVEPDHFNDRQTQGIMEFNDFVAHDESVEKVILPLRDGLTVIRIKDI